MDSDNTTALTHFDNLPKAARPIVPAMKRGFMGSCPACGSGRLFGRYLKSVDHCSSCQQDFTHHRADDLPAYLVILIVGHITVGGFMMTDLVWPLSTWLHLAIWAPLTILLALLLIQPVKGAVIGLQWATRMHGFGDNEPRPEDPL